MTCSELFWKPDYIESPFQGPFPGYSVEASVTQPRMKTALLPVLPLSSLDWSDKGVWGLRLLSGWVSALGWVSWGMPLSLLFYIFTCLFVWLHRVLAVACGIFVESRRLPPVVAQVHSG